MNATRTGSGHCVLRRNRLYGDRMRDVTLFAVAGDARVAAERLLDDAEVAWLPARRATCTVLDTFDGRIRAAGLVLQIESPGGRRLVVLGDEMMEAPLPGRIVPRLPGSLPAGPIRDRIAPLMGTRVLLASQSFTSTRTEGVIRGADGALIARLVRHERLRVADSAITGLALLEVHRVAGHRRFARELVARLTGAGVPRRRGSAGDLATAALDRPPVRFDNSPTVPLDPEIRSADGFRLVLDHLASLVEATWDGVANRTDPEFLHDFRVAIRRTRSLLTAGRQVLPDAEAEAARAGLGRLAGATSDARDLEVHLMEWGRYTAGLDASVIADLEPLKTLLSERLDAAYRQVAVTLNDDANRQIVAEWRRWLRTEHTELGEFGHQPLGASVANLVLRAHRLLLQNGRLITAESPAAQLHDLRRDAKRLRYLLECFASLMPAQPQRQFVKRLKLLQDNLGQHQDAEVHVAQLSAFAEELQLRGVDHRVLLGMGRLSERIDQRRLAARSAFAVRFAEYDTRDTKLALAEAIDHIR